jgi:outer membrane protein TolC
LAFGALAAGASAQERPYEPPTVRFPEGGLSLAEAVQLTLQHDPITKIQAAQASLREGVVRQQRGIFDFTVLGDAFTEYRLQELRASRVEIEQGKRDDLQGAIDAGEEFRPAAEQLLGELRTALAAEPGNETISDPVVQAQMVLIESLLLQVEDESGREELRKLRREILVNTASDLEAKLQKALEDLAGAKDRRARMGDTPEDEVFYRSTFALNLQKRFRSGLVVTPFADSRLDGTNFRGKERDATFGGKGVEDLYTFRGGLALTLPLLRGRGASAVAANERAAISEHQASLQTVKHQAAISTLRTAQAYWSLRAAQEALEVANRSAELQSRLVELTQRLINGGEMPAVDISRVQASQMRSRARVEDSRRRLHEARVTLAREMGITVTDDPATLPVARDTFPAPEAALTDAEASVLAKMAPAQREDLKAAVFREESGRVLVKGAKTDLRPRLDLTGRTWWTSLGEIRVSDAIDRWVGPSFSASLALDVPVGNNFFRGRLLQREADLRQRRISTADLDRQIRLNVIRTSGSLREAANRVRLAQEAVGYSRKTIEAEFEKFQAGDATLLDTIITEDQQTDALLTLVAAQQEYANLLAQLRFETGSLVADGALVKPENLVTLPRGAQQ